MLKYFCAIHFTCFQILPFPHTYLRPGLQRCELDDRFWGRTGYVPSDADVVLRTGSLVSCWWPKLTTPCSIISFLLLSRDCIWMPPKKYMFVGVFFGSRSSVRLGPSSGCLMATTSGWGNQSCSCLPMKLWRSSTKAHQACQWSTAEMLISYSLGSSFSPSHSISSIVSV